MEDKTAPREPWMVAVWPGMGNVAIGAGAFLVNRLGMRAVEEVAAREHFDIQQVEVSKGLIKAPRLPRTVIYEWRGGAKARDLYVLVGEAQPSVGAYPFCHLLIERAAARNIRRIVTFASLASQLHPSQDPRLRAVATDQALLNELARLEVQPLDEGQIGGLNGVLLGAAAERGIPAICLLAEIPFFAAGVPNPKASKAVLEIFKTLAGVELDLTPLAEQARTVDKALIDLLDRMKQAAREASGEEEEGFLPAPADDEEEHEEEEPKPTIDPAVRARLERLFEEARTDRDKAFQLKEELDRHGVFREYEGRFLDLFKRAE